MRDNLGERERHTMTSPYFASPFRYGPAYTPMGLTPGTMNVDLRAPRGRNPKEPTNEPTPTRNPSDNTNPANIAQAAGLAASTPLVSTVAGSKAQSALHSMYSAVPEPPLTANGNLNQTQFQTMIHPDPMSAPATPARTVTSPAGGGSGGFWSSLGHDLTSTAPNVWGQTGHDIAHGFDVARHGVASAADTVNSAMNNRYVKDVLNFGAIPVPGAGSTSNAPLEGNVLPKEPSPALGPAAPRVIPGQVVGQAAMRGASAPRAISSFNYGNAFEDMIRANNLNPAQFSSFANQAASRAASTPWWDTVGSDIGAGLEDVLAGVR